MFRNKNSKVKSHLSWTSWVAMLVFLSSCGTGYVNGWRDHESVSKEDRCNQVDGRQWNGSACVTEKEFQLNQTSQGQCDQREDTVWHEGQCRLIRNLNAEECQAHEGYRWSDFVCMTEAKYLCEQKPNKVYANKECRERVKPPE